MEFFYNWFRSSICYIFIPSYCCCHGISNFSSFLYSPYLLNYNKSLHMIRSLSPLVLIVEERERKTNAIYILHGIIIIISTFLLLFWHLFAVAYVLLQNGRDFFSIHFLFFLRHLDLYVTSNGRRKQKYNDKRFLFKYTGNSKRIDWKGQDVEENKNSSFFYHSLSSLLYFRNGNDLKLSLS